MMKQFLLTFCLAVGLFSTLLAQTGYGLDPWGSFGSMGKLSYGWNLSGTYMAYQNVVVIQYRLSILGFLSTGDKHAGGNWGFLDQFASLQWVRDNIMDLGGDPGSVTIFGQSTWGISASMLVAEGLFPRAIPMSGVAPLEAHYTNNSLANAKMMANLSECDDSTTEKREVQAFLGPAIDGVFLNGPPEEVLKNKEFLKVPMVVGVVNHEFGWIMAQFFAPLGWVDGIEKQSVVSVMDIFFPVYRLYTYCVLSPDGPISEEDEELSRIAMAYMANFARTGSPNELGLVEWTPFDHTESYLNLGLEQTVGLGLNQNRSHFLNVVLPQKLSIHQTANEEL